MPDPFSLAIITALIAKSAPSWLEALRGTLFDVGKGFAADQGKEMLTKGGTHLRGVFHLDEREQVRHLQSALDSAVHSGLVRLTSLEERDRYRDILTILFEPGPHSDTLRRETMHLFTLSGTADVAALNEIYNRSLRFRHLANSSPPSEVNAAPYLRCFFDALIDELYIDPYFQQQLKDALQTRAALHTAASISDVAVFTQMTAAGVTSVDNTLQQVLALLQQALRIETASRSHQLDETEGMPQQSGEISLEAEPPPSHIDQADKQVLLVSSTQDGGTAVAVEKAQMPDQRSETQLDIQRYALYVENRFHFFSPVGVVPTGEHKPVELQDLLVPQRIVLQDSTSPETRRTFITAELREVNHIVLLGGPGSGKTLLLRYLAWSHAHAYLSDVVVASSSAIPLLPGDPLPLYIALHDFSEERKRHAHYTFVTYITQLLHSEGNDIRSQLFEELLIQGKMLLLLDGLDEVMTLEERRIINQEIEQLASRYPGNRILVTSRPIGYELAPLSQKLFLQASMQEFSDEQIEQLLHRWYTYLLDFPVPLPPDAQREIDALVVVLRENPRLRKLAANPLLLTILVSLFRYERLPARRVQVYDRMAELLLGSWDKLKGTDTRWKEMHMTKHVLYMCLAHLGFVFHNHAIAESGDSESAVYYSTSDLPAGFLRREIIAFLQNEELFPEAERYAEAERFLDLVKMEAGLLVERGVNEDGEALYGFVHRSFQEYFAAYYVFELYKEGDSSVLNDFLRTHLHDPHWQEVILLLLGKLWSKHVTTLLRQLLTGQIETVRSSYTHLLHQDLLFVSDCLAEEIIVESQLVEEVISTLCQAVKSSPLPSQKADALKALHRLMNTKPYAALARSALKKAAMQPFSDIHTSIRILEMLNELGMEGSEGTYISQVFLAWIQSLDFPLKHILQLACSWYEKREQSLEEQRQVIEVLRHFHKERDGMEVQQRRAQAILLAIPYSSYAEKAKAIQAIAILLPQDEAKYCIAAYWRSAERVIAADEASSVATLTQEEMLPIGIRDDLYRLLRSMVPLFHQESS